MNNFSSHSFHVPVMGIGYTIDSPLKLAHFGISSVVSLVDDMLMEKMREFHSQKANFPFQGISSKIEDFRARRITAFLDLMDGMVKEKIAEMKSSFSRKSEEVDKYFEMLPTASKARQTYFYLKQNASFNDLKEWVMENLHPGHIDVNIMTKLDKPNFSGSEQLPVEFNDAHAALRGFAKSKLSSSLVLSAGMNPRLFSYMEKWDDFFPDESGNIKKKVTIKVSDFRSAMVQGKMLAKKGIWVSEFRIESGLNCGGHAFASQGNLIGPVLEEFKEKRKDLVNDQYHTFCEALSAKGMVCPKQPPLLRVSAQGGVGTNAEHNFLLNHYRLDAVGWGTPFLMVPEAVSIDSDTISKLGKAREEDLYLSDISPLGVPFNNLRGNTKDQEKEANIKANNPGSRCTKHYCSLNTEFSKRPICTASRQYQRKKILLVEAELASQQEIDKAIVRITEKSCICVGLGTSALLANGLSFESEGPGVSVCPGPNMAYFDKQVTLKEMTDHIYGRNNLISRTDRPSVFLKELELYINYFFEKLKPQEADDNRMKASNIKFLKAITESISYYRQLYTKHSDQLGVVLSEVLNRLSDFEKRVKGSLVAEM
ncbi:hypothetical protein [Marinilabilia sp.]|uniref:hypothetical protein n=1 Tax=Marinilabilia sp. TaxID=2021252 RepID=UPI0025C53C51|nr:hypothetical protein [Marinilabilia sp.]